jgi:hypothetical protein
VREAVISELRAATMAVEKKIEPRSLGWVKRKVERWCCALVHCRHQSGLGCVLVHWHERRVAEPCGGGDFSKFRIEFKFKFREPL